MAAKVIYTKHHLKFGKNQADNLEYLGFRRRFFPLFYWCLVLRRGGNKENWEELSVLEPDDNTETDPKSAEKHLDAQEILNEKFGGIKISDDVLDEVAGELAERCTDNGRI